ncbi:MAG: efflux RND transporter periplasmic adaptor subunit [Pseudomonadota bacterium]
MNKQLVLTAVIAVAAGLAGGYFLAERPQQSTGEMSAAQPSAERKVLFWRNPMNPAITSPVFTKDEMGMDYLPVYADEGEAKEATGTVKIDPTTVQNIGVRTAEATQQALARKIRALGRVAYDEGRLTRLHPKTEGWIEQLYVEKTGEHVARDAMLLSIYSPQLVSSQQEYLLAVKNHQALKDSPYEDIRQGAAELVQSARERLELLDVPAHQLHELEQNQRIQKSLHIHSPFDGVVINVGARKGQYVTPETELYMLADLSKVWAFVDVYEDELPWVRVGDQAQMTVAGAPGKTFTGKVSYIYPYMEAKTRTARVRLEFDNREQLLKPDMYAEVQVQAARQTHAVVVPSEAVVRSGDRNQVFVQREPGKFEPREVRLGLSSEGMTQILAGVTAGERVVTSSQFLIDSESKLREATAKMLEAQGSTTADEHAGHDLSDLDMEDMRLDTPPAPVKQPKQEAAHDHQH